MTNYVRRTLLNRRSSRSAATRSSFQHLDTDAIRVSRWAPEARLGSRFRCRGVSAARPSSQHRSGFGRGAAGLLEIGADTWLLTPTEEAIEAGENRLRRAPGVLGPS